MEKGDRLFENRRIGVLAKHCLEWPGNRGLKKTEIAASLCGYRPCIGPYLGDQLVVDVFHIASAEHTQANSILWQDGSSSRSTAPRQKRGRDQPSFPASSEPS